VLDVLVRVKITANRTPASKRSTRANAIRRYLQQWRRSRYFMLKSPSSSSSTSSSADGLPRFFNSDILKNLRILTQLAKLYWQMCSYRWVLQMTRRCRVSGPWVWTLAILHKTNFRKSLALLLSGIHIKIGAMFPKAEWTVNQTGSNHTCDLWCMQVCIKNLLVSERTEPKFWLQATVPMTSIGLVPPGNF